MDHAIEIRGLVKRYRNFTLGPIDLSVPRGAIYGLIGPNGAGKTTLIDLIFGMGRNDEGVIRINGLDHREQDVEMKRQTAYVSPELSFRAWKKVGWAVQFVSSFYPEWDHAYCSELMKAFDLSASDKVANLSFGARTKLSLLVALARKPRVLILDEPTTGLDAISKQQVFAEMLKAVEDGNRTVLISSHGLSDIERFADHVGMIKKGKLLIEGSMDQVVDRYRMAEYFTPSGVTIPPCKGLLVTRRNGERSLALVDTKSEAKNWLTQHGAKNVSMTPLPLEDLFVALAKDEVAQ